MKKAYKIISEWDLGYNESELFKSEEAALNSLKKNLTVKELCEDGDTLEALMEDGLIVIKELKIK